MPRISIHDGSALFRGPLKGTALLLLLLCAAPALRADPVEDAVRQGIEELYNVRFDDAARSFDRAVSLDPKDPRGHFYRANVHLWSFLFDKQEAQAEAFFNASDKAIRVAQARVDANPRDSRSMMFLGMSYGFRAIANAKSENFMSAALSAKTCYDRLSEVVKKDPKQYDAYFGLGIFHFIFGSVPKAASLVVGLGGIKGDAQLGIREIGLVAANGSYLKNDAQLVMALLDIYYRNDLKRGAAGLEKLAARYPRNVAILYALGSAYLDQGQPDRAVTYLDRVAQQGNSDFKAFTDLSYGRCGTAFFSKNDFAKARTYLQKFLKRSDEKMLRAYSWYLLGLCFEFEGNRANAVKAYERSVKGPRFSSPEDMFAVRKAKQLIEAPLTETGKDVIRALNLSSTGDHAGAIALGNKILATRDVTVAHKAQAWYAIGQGLQSKGEHAKAIDAFRKAIGVGKHTEDWVPPFSHFHIAECHLKLGDRDNWKKNIERAKDFYDYDNEKILRFKIERDVTTID